MDLNQRLAKAFNQINATAAQIRSRHPAFAAIPHDRPIIGLVVTMEPFHVVNAQPYRQWLPDSTEPVLVCAAFELERLVTVQGRTAGDILLEIGHDNERREWGVGLGVERAQGVNFERNLIIDAAWSKLAWGANEHTNEADDHVRSDQDERRPHR